jgi:hypothetical protein
VAYFRRGHELRLVILTNWRRHSLALPRVADARNNIDRREHRQLCFVRFVRNIRFAMP